MSNSASSLCCLTTMAPLKPIFSKALFHSRMASVITARYFSGTLRSSQKVIGLTGSDNSVFGSFFSRRQRSIIRTRGERATSSLKSSTDCVIRPMRASARRGTIGSAGKGASEKWWPMNRLRTSGTYFGTVGTGAPGGAPAGGSVMLPA